MKETPVEKLRYTMQKIIESDMDKGIVHDSEFTMCEKIQNYLDANSDIEYIIMAARIFIEAIEPLIEAGHVYVHKNKNSYIKLVRNRGLISNEEYETGLRIIKYREWLKDRSRSPPIIPGFTTFNSDPDTGRFLKDLIVTQYISRAQYSLLISNT